MKKLSTLSVIAAGAAMLTLSGCSLFSSSTDEVKVDYIAVQQDEDGKWSLLGPDGNLICDGEFKEAPTAVVNGFFSVQEGETYALYQVAEGKSTMVLDKLGSVGYFNEGVIPASKANERIGIYDEKGNKKASFDPYEGHEIISTDEAFHNGLIPVMTDQSLYGYANKEGQMVIKPAYTLGCKFSDGLAVAYKTTDDKSVACILNTEGDVVARLKEDLYPDMAYKFGKLAATEKDGRCGFVSKDGEYTRLSAKARGISDYNESYIIFYDDEFHYGLMAFKDEEIIIRPRYTHLEFVNNELLLANDDGDYSLINIKGEKVIRFNDFEFVTTATNASSFPIIGKEGSFYRLINNEGKDINKTEFVNYTSMLTPMNLVVSDFFSIEAVVNTLTNKITADGYEGYKLGEKANKLNIAAGDYIYTASMTLDPESGFMYNVETKIRFNDNIGIRLFTGWGGSSEPILNEDAAIEAIQLDVDAQKTIWPAAKDKIATALKAKGYTVEKNTDQGLVLKQGKTYVTVIGKDKAINIVIANKSVLRKFGEGYSFVKQEVYNDLAPEIPDISDVILPASAW